MSNDEGSQGVLDQADDGRVDGQSSSCRHRLCDTPRCQRQGRRVKKQNNDWRGTYDI